MPPFLQLYRAVYRWVARRALRIFRDYPAVRAVYLRRGGARGEILPLVSDLDFAVIVDGLPEHERDELRARYERLAERVTILDRSLELYDEAAFFKSFRTNDYARFRFSEGRHSWKLLHGRDYLSELPEPSLDGLDGGLYTEIKVWWTLFAWRFFRPGKYAHETVTRNSMCFKTVAEILRMSLALRRRDLPGSRAEALSRAAGDLGEDDRGFARRVAALAAAAFRKRDDAIVEDTRRFVLRHLDRLYADLADHPLGRASRDLSQVVDAPPDERLLDGGIESAVEQVVDAARELFPEALRGVAMVPGCYFNLDEHLVVVGVDPERTPGIDTWRSLLQRPSRDARARKRLKLFLLLDHALFQLDPDEFTQSWQSILTPFANPDVFEALRRPEASVAGQLETPSPGPAWTPVVEHFFVEEKALFYELLADPAVYKLEALDFLRVFWKTAQLVVMNRTAAAGEVVYPLTPGAVERRLARLGLALPPPLTVLREAYPLVLQGRMRDLADFIPEAIAYLKEIES